MAGVYRPRRPRDAPYFEVVRQNANTLFDVLSNGGVDLPRHVRQRFFAFLGCGDLGRGFLRVRCPDCAFERLLPFSCKGRAVCPSCSAKRSAAQTAHLIDRVLPDVPVRQWVLSLPFELRPLVSVNPELHGPLNRIFIDEIARYYGHDGRSRWAGAVSVIQRFGAALNLHVHFHVLALDGVYEAVADDLDFRAAARPTTSDLETTSARLAERIAHHLVGAGYIDEHGVGLWSSENVVPARGRAGS